MAGPLRKDELGALESLARDKTKKTGIDEGILQRLSSLGLVKQERTGVALTARGKMDLQRRNSLGRKKR